jgi:hypothetical protein
MRVAMQINNFSTINAVQAVCLYEKAPDAILKKINDYLDLSDHSLLNHMLLNKRIYRLTQKSSFFVLAQLIRKCANESMEQLKNMNLESIVKQMDAIQTHPYMLHLARCHRRIDPKCQGILNLYDLSVQFKILSISDLILNNDAFTLGLVKALAVDAIERLPFPQDKKVELRDIGITGEYKPYWEREQQFGTGEERLVKGALDLFGLDTNIVEGVFQKYTSNPDFLLKSYWVNPKIVDKFGVYKEDRDFMVKAARINLAGLQGINSSLFRDPSFLGEISYINASLTLHFISAADMSNTRFMCTLVSKNGYLLKLIKDKNGLVIYEAVKQDGYSIQYAPPETRGAKSYARAAVKQNPDAYKFIMEPAKSDPEIIALAKRV